MPKFRIPNSLEEAIFRRWVFFNLFALSWFVIVFPILFVFERGIFSVIATIIMVLCVILDSVKFKVAERSPKIFLKVENMKTYFSKAYWLFIYLPSVAFFLTALFLPAKNMKEIASVFVPVFAGFILIFIGATFYESAMVGNVTQQPRLLKTRAAASFTVLSKSLKNASTRKYKKLVGFARAISGKRPESHKDKERMIKLFENGMNSLNRLFINLFNFEFCNLKKRNDYFRFVIWSEDSLEIYRFRKLLDVMGCQLRKKLDVSDILWTTEQILKQKQFIPKEELFRNLDFKTGLGRWYSHNKEIIQIALPISSLVVSILAFLVRFM